MSKDILNANSGIFVVEIMFGAYAIYKIGQILEWLKPSKSLSEYASEAEQEAEEVYTDVNTPLDTSAPANNAILYVAEQTVLTTDPTTDPDRYISACLFVLQHSNPDSAAYHKAQQYLGSWNYRALHLNDEPSDAKAWEVVTWVRAHPGAISQEATDAVNAWVAEYYRRQNAQAHTQGNPEHGQRSVRYNLEHGW